MATTVTHRDRRDSQPDEQPSDIRTTARRYGAFNLVAGALGLVGPLVWGNDDDLINLGAGLFLGRIAVNSPHAALHAVHGLHGIRAGRDAESARRYMGVSGAFFALFAAVGIGKFGFERGVHHVAGLAVDGYGNAGHAVLSAFSVLALSRND
ncbi:DUF4383 domain-containing protein [Halosimplex aquaticum]|uniref:DUF4383 domain-containing protein n=1 Tax=Halosimplex aquaticum TaxID=3026162 RepID=A0ABD5XZS2_9EURY|nr:DUF4383 domain-containing protein [Halosimplex aquaticum]